MKRLSIFFVFITIITACQTVIDVDIPLEEPKLVVNSVLASGERFAVHLSESQHILDGAKFKNIIGAEVKIYENDEFLTNLQDFDSELGFYTSEPEFMVKEGKTYRIEVNKNGFQTVSAECRIPQKAAKIASVSLDAIEINDYGYVEKRLEFDIEIEDEIGADNFYELLVLEEGYAYNYDYNTTPPTLIDSTWFIERLYLESSDPSLEEYQEYGQSIIFDDAFFDGRKYHMKVNASYYFNDSGSKNEKNYTIVLRNTSHQYYLYRQSVELQSWTEDDPFAQPVQVYSNIINGFGIFAGYNNKMQFKITLGG